MTLKDRVKDILQKQLTARDSDTYLTREIYHQLLIKMGGYPSGVYGITVVQFLTLQRHKSLPLQSTIIRYRAELQDKYEELRGTKYLERQLKGGQKAVEAVRGYINLEDL